MGGGGGGGSRGGGEMNLLFHTTLTWYLRKIERKNAQCIIAVCLTTRCRSVSEATDRLKTVKGLISVYLKD